MATVSPSLKKEAVVKVVDIYRQFVNDSSRTQDRITIIQHLAKYGMIEIQTKNCQVG